MKNQLENKIKNSIQHWYIPLIVGVIFIGSGLYTFASPLKSYLALSIIFSISFIASGLSEVFFSISNRDKIENYGWTLFFGLSTLLIGLLMITNPKLSMTTLPMYVGFVLLFRSIGAISYSIDLKRYGVSAWGMLMTFGVLGAIFSFMLIRNPVFAGMTIVIWTGISLITVGLFSTLVAFKLRTLNKTLVSTDSERIH